MPSQRLLISLEPPIHRILKEIAKRNKVSVSSVGRDLIKEALEIKEDLYWDKVAYEREKNFNWKGALPHKKVWKTK